ncbi:hypothetical protein Naga_102457g1, partial [Nannochloropsis gaditana]
PPSFPPSSLPPSLPPSLRHEPAVARRRLHVPLPRGRGPWSALRAWLPSHLPEGRGEGGAEGGREGGVGHLSPRRRLTGARREASSPRARPPPLALKKSLAPVPVPVPSPSPSLLPSLRRSHNNAVNCRVQGDVSRRSLCNSPSPGHSATFILTSLLAPSPSLPSSRPPSRPPALPPSAFEFRVASFALCGGSSLGRSLHAYYLQRRHRP